MHNNEMPFKQWIWVTILIHRIQKLKIHCNLFASSRNIFETHSVDGMVFHKGTMHGRFHKYTGLGDFQHACSGNISVPCIFFS